MKRTYEVPQRIYLVIDPVWGSMSVNYNRNDTNNIEYAHTDAFVEKACDWLEKHTLYAFDLDFGHSLQMKYFIEDFKNYMKGE